MKLRVAKVSRKSKSYRMYLPEYLGEKFAGDPECLPNALTLTIVKPGASDAELEHSLEIILDDVRLRQGKRKLRQVMKGD